MLSVDPVAKELDDDNVKEIILENNNKIHNIHIKKHPLNIELCLKKIFQNVCEFNKEAYQRYL